MKFVKVITVLLSSLALLTGAMDVVIGVAGQANIGVGNATSVPLDPVLDRQVRFLGAVWLGLGAIQLVCLGDLRRYSTILQLCFAIVILGGIGRALSLLQAGHPSSDIGTARMAGLPARHIGRLRGLRSMTKWQSTKGSNELNVRERHHCAIRRDIAFYRTKTNAEH
jgi:hypothetical protein